MVKKNLSKKFRILEKKIKNLGNCLIGYQNETFSREPPLRKNFKFGNKTPRSKPLLQKKVRNK
jgi:hypothetical protein